MKLLVLGVLRMPKRLKDPSIWVAVPVGEGVIAHPGMESIGDWWSYSEGWESGASRVSEGLSQRAGWRPVLVAPVFFHRFCA